MIGDYHYRCKGVNEEKSRFGISQIEGIIENNNGFIASIELIKKPEQKIILLDNIHIEPQYRTSGQDYIQRIIRQISKEFEENREYDGQIKLLESDNPKDRAWQRVYDETGWEHFSSCHPYSQWLAKGMNLEDREQVGRARKVIKRLFKL